MALSSTPTVDALSDDDNRPRLRSLNAPLVLMGADWPPAVRIRRAAEAEAERGGFGILGRLYE